MKRPSTDRLSCFVTPVHDCPYIATRRAATLFVDPSTETDARLYSRLSRRGFRRSGDLIYRPQCPECHACVAIRVPVDEFEPRRRDRRCLRENADLGVIERPGALNSEHIALYRRYVAARHAESPMQDLDDRRLAGFLYSNWMASDAIEFRLAGQLLAVAITDRLDDGLSAVYTFFDPAHSARGLGNFAILTQIRLARRAGLPFVYLGFWVGGDPQMEYKARFRPLQAWLGDHWRRLGPGMPLPESAAASGE